MTWKLAAPLRVVFGVIRDEVAVQRLQRRYGHLRNALPGYSNDEIDRVFQRVEQARRRRRAVA